MAFLLARRQHFAKFIAPWIANWKYVAIGVKQASRSEPQPIVAHRNIDIARSHSLVRGLPVFRITHIGHPSGPNRTTVLPWSSSWPRLAWHGLHVDTNGPDQNFSRSPLCACTWCTSVASVTVSDSRHHSHNGCWLSWYSRSRCQRAVLYRCSHGVLARYLGWCATHVPVAEHAAYAVYDMLHWWCLVGGVPSNRCWRLASLNVPRLFADSAVPVPAPGMYLMPASTTTPARIAH